MKLSNRSNISASELPSGAFLAEYSKTGAYTDCYSVEVSQHVDLPEYVEAFYTTPIFKIERFILARLAGMPSIDRDAHDLAHGQVSRFAAWEVESRASDQVILAAGRTRSWLMVDSIESGDSPSCRLYFGSAVVPAGSGKLGWHFKALLGFHKLYSRILLGSAVRRLNRRQAAPSGLQ